MTHEYLLWISLAAYALHIFEEAALDWKGWTDWRMRALGVKSLSWGDFYVANAAVIIGGVCCAMVGWKLPMFSLLFPALQLINGAFFHVLPTLLYRRFSPGLFTACTLFFPIGIWVYWGAWSDGVLNIAVFVGSWLLGFAVMATPFVFLKLRYYLENNR